MSAEALKETLAFYGGTALWIAAAIVIGLILLCWKKEVITNENT